MNAPNTENVTFAKVLLEIGETDAAERAVVAILEHQPEDLSALNLYAKIKHMRGEISQAVACWAQLHARSPHNEIGLMALSTILHLAQDPERGADEFLALGQSQLARKPLHQLELEKAFRLYLAHRPAEARAVCQGLARKHRARDRQMYRLAVLADAWIAELSGDLEAACTVLEALGCERGYETDTDRALSLMRVYERIGTPERLQSVLNIGRYIEAHFEKMSMISRLAATHRRLGNAALADEYDRRYLEAFRRRMHRPSREEVVQVAARRYLPLARLSGLLLPPAQSPAGSAAAAGGAAQRERAISLVLQGELAAARGLLQQGSEPLDRRYLADLAVLAGTPDEALRLHLEVVRAAPEDLTALGWLLANGHPEVAALFAAPEVARRALSSLQAGVRATPLRADLWRQLAVLYGILGEGEEAARCRARAQTLQEAEARQAGPVGRVLAAAVYHFVGKAKGLIHEVWAERRPAGRGQGGFLRDEDILGNLTPDLKRAVRNIFLAVREYARAKLPHLTGDILDYDYAYKVTKEDEPSGGLSAGLPSALAFLSVFLQRPVPQDMAFTGMLVSDSHDVMVVRRIGEAEYKIKGAYNRNLRVLVLPLENRPDVLGSREVPRAISDEIVRYAGSLDEVVRLTFGEALWL